MTAHIFQEKRAVIDRAYSYAVLAAWMFWLK
jgi:hypothetical protein